MFRFCFRFRLKRGCGERVGFVIIRDFGFVGVERKRIKVIFKGSFRGFFFIFIKFGWINFGTVVF